jgi:hypothetical protein
MLCFDVSISTLSKVNEYILFEIARLVLTLVYMTQNFWLDILAGVPGLESPSASLTTLDSMQSLAMEKSWGSSATSYISPDPTCLLFLLWQGEKLLRLNLYQHSIRLFKPGTHTMSNVESTCAAVKSLPLSWT